MERSRHGRHARSWVAMTVGLGLHVTDEAYFDFLEFYNPWVTQIRVRWPFLPPLTMEMGTWLTLLGVAILALLALTPLVRQGRKAMDYLSTVYSMVMLANGIGHIAVSIMMGRAVPGVVTAPILIVLALDLWFAGQRAFEPEVEQQPAE